MSCSAIVTIPFQIHISQKYLRNPQKQKQILTEGPLFGSLKPLTFRTFCDMSRFYVGFTDSDSVTTWVHHAARTITIN